MLRRFIRDEEGVALAYFAVALPALLGIALLVLDIGRGNNLQLDLQNAADSIALAAAAELDGDSDAMVRAWRAVENLAKNQARFGDDGAFLIDDMSIGDAVNEFRVYFLKSIPDDDVNLIDWIIANDSELVTWAESTAEASEVSFAAVFIEPVNYTLLFPVSFLDDTDVAVGANAVAGFRSVVCDFTPMFICNPYDSRAELENAVSNIGTRRRLFELRLPPGQHSEAAPGQYGFLSSPLGNGASGIRDMLASDNPHACFAQDGVDLEPGNLGNAAAAALNVRFDIYEQSSMSSKRNADHYQPAPNTRKGFDPQQGNQCDAEGETIGDGRMPRDNCFATSNCPLLTGQGGDGEWACGTYWAANHGAEPPPAGCDDTPDANLPSRYDVYLYEIQHNLLEDEASNGEDGVPECYRGNTEKTADRRLLYAAILDCPVAEPSDAEVVVYASFFLTEPADHGADSAFWAELVDITGRFGRGSLDEFERDDVQLYR